METIHITMPDGRDARSSAWHDCGGDRASDFARLAKEARCRAHRPSNGPAGAPLSPTAHGEGILVDLRAPIDQDVRLFDPDAEGSRRDPGAASFGGASCSPRRCSNCFPNVKLGIGPPIDTGFFYDFVRDEPFTPEDLERIEKKMRELAAQDIPNERKMMPKRRRSSFTGSGARASNANWWRSERLSRWVVLHHRKNVIRFLPGAAHPFDRTHPRVQADERCRRLLERPGRQPADAAHLRGLLLHSAGSSTSIFTARRGQAARSPAARARARFVFDPGRSRAGTDFLAPQRRPCPAN